MEVPEDILYVIIKNSTVDEIINLYYVDKRFKRILNEPHILKRIIFIVI